MSNYHVVPLGPNWAVKSNGHIISVYSTQEEARQNAVMQARLCRSEVVIHRKDGRIRSKDSYGNDPFPPKG